MLQAYASSAHRLRSAGEYSRWGRERASSACSAPGPFHADRLAASRRFPSLFLGTLVSRPQMGRQDRRRSMRTGRAVPGASVSGAAPIRPYRVRPREPVPQRETTPDQGRSSSAAEAGSGGRGRLGRSREAVPPSRRPAGPVGDRASSRPSSEKSMVSRGTFRAVPRCRRPARGLPPRPDPHRMNRRIRIFRPVSSEFLFGTPPARPPDAA